MNRSVSFFWLAVLFTTIPLWAAQPSPTLSKSKKVEKLQCTVAIQVSASTHLGRHTLNEVRRCTGSILEIEYSVKPTRSLTLSPSKYNQYSEGVRNTLAELKNFPSTSKPCRSVHRVKVNWDQQKAEFASCQDDERFILVQKLNDLIRDLYLEPK